MATPTTLPSTFVAGNVLTAAEMNDLRGAFRILQVVRATDTSDRVIASATYVDVTGVTVTITPTSTSSNLLIHASFEIWLDENGTSGTTATSFRLVDSGGTPLSGAEDSLFGTLRIGVYDQFAQINLFGYVSPATTSAVTYKLQAKCDVTDVTVRGSKTTTQMFAQEISA